MSSEIRMSKCIYHAKNKIELLIKNDILPPSDNRANMCALHACADKMISGCQGAGLFLQAAAF